MNNHTTHNHTLSKEELLSLLEKKASHNPIEDNSFDDFEKEALEGFSLHTTSAQAKKLMTDVDFSISQKTTSLQLEDNEKPNDTKKRTALWLSMAASLALIVGLSVFFLNQKVVETENNMALNKDVSEKTPSNEISPSVLNPEIPSTSEEQEGKTVSLKNTENLSSTLRETQLVKNLQNESGSDDKNKNDAAATGGSQMPLANTSVYLEQKAVVEKETEEMAVVYNNDNSDLAKGSMASSVPATADFKIKDKAKAESNDDKEITTVASETKVASKKSSEVRSEVDAEKTSSITIKEAYYKGGKKAIKKQVLNYEKTKPFSQKLQGSFLVKAIVKINGTIKVTAIEPIKTADAMYTNYLTEALNNTTGWTPASQNEVKFERATQFTLDF